MTTCPASAPTSSATTALARLAVGTDVDRAADALRPGLRGLFLDHIGIAAFAAARAESSLDRPGFHGGFCLDETRSRRYGR